MVEIIEAMPSGLVPPMPELSCNIRPEVRIEGREIVIPVLCRVSTEFIAVPADEENEEYVGEIGVFHYYEVRTAFEGGDISNYTEILSLYWKPLREAFYGSPEFQADLEYDHRKTAHILAVKDTFRKPGQTSAPDGIARWTAVKQAFWTVVDAALEEMKMTRDQLPAYFNAEYMLELAKTKLTAEKIETLTTMLEMVSFDMLHNGRNWSELFRNE